MPALAALFFLVDRAPDIPAGRVLAAAGKYAALPGATLSVAEPTIAGFLAEVASCTADGERIGVCLNSRFDERYHLYVDAGRPIVAADIALVDLFRLKSCATLDEIFLQRQNRQMQRHAIRTMAANALPAHSQVSGGVLKRIEEYTIAIADAVVAQRIHPELRLGEFIDFFDAFKKESSSPESGKNGTAVSQSLAARIMALACALEQMTSASPFEEPEAVERALSKLENRAEFRRDAAMLTALSVWLKSGAKRTPPTSPAISPT